MSVNPRRALDPFVFPSETRGRFRMLVVAALLVGLNLAQVVVEIKQGEAERARLTQILEAYGGVKIIDLWNLDPAELEAFRRKYHDLTREALAIGLRRLSILVKFLAVLVSLAIGIYVLHPLRIRRRHRLHPLSEDQAPTVVGYLRCCADRLRVPWLRFECRPGLGEGVAYGLRGREALFLYGAPVFLERAWGATLKAIVLHELGHIVNGDAADREKARAVWQALLIVLSLGVAMVAALAIHHLILVAVDSGGLAALAAFAETVEKSIPIGWPLLALLLFIRLIRAGLIRSREFYADWRVATWGFGGILYRMLNDEEESRGVWWKRWWRLHPSHRLRREALADPGRLFRVSPDLAFTTGVLLMVVLSSGFLLLSQLGFFVSALSGSWVGSASWFQTPSLRLLEMVLLQGGPVLLFLTLCLVAISFLITATLGIQVQRAALADLAVKPSRSWGYLRLFAPAFLLSFGMEVGLLLTPFKVLPSVFSRPVQFIIWFIGFTVLMWLWLAYLRAATRLSLGTWLGLEVPRSLRSLLLLSGVLLLSILFWPAATTRVVFLLQPEVLPLWLTGGRDPWEYFVYVHVMTTMMLAVFAVFTYLVWSSTGLAAFLVMVFRRRWSCPTCNKTVRCGFSVGRICDACGESLAPWAYLKPTFDPGEPEEAA